MSVKYNIMFFYVVAFFVLTFGGKIIDNSNCGSGTGNCDLCVIDVVITARNVESLRNCTKVIGNVVLAPGTFKEMHPSQLEVFSNLKQIFGILEVRVKHPDFQSLHFFRHLELIQNTDPYGHPLYIEDTSLQSLELNSLKQIKSRLGVFIHNNKELCLTESFNWSLLRDDYYFPNKIYGNAGPSECSDKEFTCDDSCTQDGCWGRGPGQCLQCKLHKIGNICERPKLSSDEDYISVSCPMDYYTHNNECKPCENVCIKGCSGPNTILGTNGCNSCNKVLVIDNAIQCLAFEDSCPYGYMEEIVPLQNDIRFKNLTGKILCRKIIFPGVTNVVEHDLLNMNLIVILVIILVVFAIATLYTFLRLRCDWFYKKKSNKNDYTKVSLTDPVLEVVEIIPNMSRISSIKETEFNRTKLLGRGAFGTVYEGLWKPNNSSDGMPVAIKVLHENSSSTSTTDFLVEAFIMATMDHPNVLKLMAICVTSEIMLLTQIMPFGCLLEYVRNDKEHITPKRLIAWSTQIAKGMAYLEEKRLVHRDLAARNILLESADCVKITDFGLSKFISNNIYEQTNSNTKLPIKWLALECLEGKEFSHKSDVWAYGTTIWELLTFGERPFDNIPARALPHLLKHGEKLSQPLVCSTELYLVLIRCWILKPELRPEFKELVNIFESMSLDPRRYIASVGDDRFKMLSSNWTNIEVQILRSLILGEEERGQSQYQVLCFIVHVAKDAFISSDAMAKLRQKNPGTVRIPEEDRGRENYTLDYRVDVRRAAVLSPFVADLCSEARDSSYTREQDVQQWATLQGLAESTFLPMLKGFPLPQPKLDNNHLADEQVGAAQHPDELTSGTIPMPSCSDTKTVWSQCQCHLELCIGWYPCGLKYCKGNGNSKTTIQGGKDGVALKDGGGKDTGGGDVEGKGATSYRCGIKTCRKCHMFSYYVDQKQLCLWDE